jgi:dTDP-4-amino-4,6-dideoxygalactose transaminase
MIPPVVLNAIITSGNKYVFYDDVDWIGNSYVLHHFDDYKFVDSAQKLEKNQFANECEPNDLMVFSFYPTKPIGSSDGGMIVSNDLNKIIKLKEMAFNGMSYAHNNWDRKIMFPGYKMYMNSIQCDIALRNFKNYNSKLEKLNEVRNIYNSELSYNNSSNHLYRIEIGDRDEFIKYMKKNGVVCGVHYESMHLNPTYAQDSQKCPLSEIKSKITASIPFNESLTKKEIFFILDLIKKFKYDRKIQ